MKLMKYPSLRKTSISCGDGEIICNPHLLFALSESKFDLVLRFWRRFKEKMKDDEELQMLLNEIPHATSNDVYHLNLLQEKNPQGPLVRQSNDSICGMSDFEPSSHNYTFASSPASGFSLPSDGSSSSLFSGGDSLSDIGTPTPPPLEELKSDVTCGNGTPLCTKNVWLDSARKRVNENFSDELISCRDFGNINAGNGNVNSSNHSDLTVGVRSHPVYSFERCRDVDGFEMGNTNFIGVQSLLPRSANCFDYKEKFQLNELDNLYGSQSDVLFFELNGWNSPKCSSRQTLKADELISNSYISRHQISNLATSIHGLSMADSSFCAQKNKKASPQLTYQPRAYANTENMSCYGWVPSSGRLRTPASLRVLERGGGGFIGEDSLIIQGDARNFVVNKARSRSWGQTKGTLIDDVRENTLVKKLQLEAQNRVADICANDPSPWMPSPFMSLLNSNSLADARGKLYIMAKDQHGCRFLQRIFDEGTPQDVEIIFNEIIHYVVELMLNPFGNYLIQKLLDVCNEKQKMQILLVITKEPGELVRISLNTHGTRVVQKLVETLKTRQQIRLVTSALEPGFLALIRDPNGNHVVQRCLQCLCLEDTKANKIQQMLQQLRFTLDLGSFIIGGRPTRYCVEIATHQHGCCVLQRCIRHSTGEHQQKLVEEISSNGLLLAQDAYGNYVVQFILELKIPSAMSRLMSQFEGKYVHLSMQKFSSHVVEKCLAIFNEEDRSRIINELIFTHHFDQLLQDPHANYVVQTALRLSEGATHNSLVMMIESHKAIAQNSPYSKKIFSQRLLKK